VIYETSLEETILSILFYILPTHYDKFIPHSISMSHLSYYTSYKLSFSHISAKWPTPPYNALLSCYNTIHLYIGGTEFKFDLLVAMIRYWQCLTVYLLTEQTSNHIESL